MPEHSYMQRTGFRLTIRRRTQSGSPSSRTTGIRYGDDWIACRSTARQAKRRRPRGKDDRRTGGSAEPETPGARSYLRPARRAARLAVRWPLRCSGLDQDLPHPQRAGDILHGGRLRLLNAAAGLSTAYATNSPVLCIAGQIVSHDIEKGKGLLHEIPNQLEMVRS